MKKRIGSLLMALVLALSLVPATVWAADDPISVDTFEELQAAIASDADTIDIVVTNDIELTQELTISGSKKDITIRSQEGSTYKLLRSASFQPNADDYKSEYAFRLKAGKLTFQNIILDGNKDAVTAKNTFVFVTGSNDTQLTLGQGATIQNCASTGYGGAVYVSMGKLVMEEGSAIKDCTTSYRGGAIAMIYEPWSNYSTGAITFTMKGATISGCSTTGSANYAQGGAIFTSGRVTMDIQGSTIESNTANGNGGAIYGASTNYSGDIVLNLSGTTITGNTSAELGGGVYFAGTTFTVSGVTDITGNTGKGSSNNVYLAAGKTVSGSGLQEGSKVGISGANIPSTLVTGYADDSETGYFTADRTETKLKATTGGGLELVGREDHTHCICGRTDCDGTPEGHRMITCKGVSSLDLIKDSGSYYLLNDVTLTKTWKAPSGITLCLNGFSIQGAAHTAALTLSTYGSIFNLTDCGSTGKVTSTPYGSKGNRYDSSGVVVAKDVTFNLYNGSICDLSLDAYQNDLLAGAVEVNGTFNMYGGSIKDNQGDALQPTSTKPYTGGVLVNSTGVFNLYGGEISGNYSSNKEATWPVAYNGGAVNVRGGQFNMSGGVIKNNTAGTSKAASDGGGVYVTTSNNKKGAFTMTGGEISGNTAIRNGGGVAVVNGTFKMSGDAIITGNSAQIDWQDYEHKGGGVFVGAGSTFTMSENASISGNLVRSGYTNSNAQGAGVYVSEGGTFTMNDNASIKSNTMTVQYRSTVATLYGGGVFVGGTLNLSGGAIEDNNAYYEAGGIYVDTKGTVNLGTGKITVQDNKSENTIFSNLYLPGEKKLTAVAAPAADSNIVLSLPLARIQNTEGSVVITNTGKDILDGDSRFSFEVEKMTLVRDGDGDDVLAKLPAHTHADGTTYTPVYKLSDIPSNATGSYYLVQDGSMASSVTVGAGNTLNVCLNGHSCQRTYFKNSGTLNITDCQHSSANPGRFTGYTNTYNGDYSIDNASGSTLNMTNLNVSEASGITFVLGNAGSTVNITGCNFEDNTTSVLRMVDAKVTITDCTFKNNTSSRPILWALDGSDTASFFTVKKCIFTGNVDNDQNANDNYSRGTAVNSGCPGTTLIENCTITGNLSHGDGGGIYLYGKGTATIKNTTVENNESQRHGGGIAVDSTNAPVFTGTVVVKNNTSRHPITRYLAGDDPYVTCNVFLDDGCTIATDSGFNAGASKIGISAWNVPSLVMSGNTSAKGFFVDDTDFVLRPTTSSSPLLTTGNTGLEIWHKGANHTHCICGTGANTTDGHTHNNSTRWIGVTTLKNLPEGGNYFLLRDYTYEQWTPTVDYNICLNGKRLADSSRSSDAIVNITNRNSVAITDCSENNSGKITCIYNSANYSRGVKVGSGSTFTLWNGQLTGLWAHWPGYSSSTPNGGGVWVNGGTFIMNGGSISAWTRSGNGGAVYVESGAFTMNGGTISKSSAVDGGAVYAKGSTVAINGGTITGNTATADGGGIHADKSTLTIGKANITDNTATNGGGGIYAYECALTIDGATVTGNNGGDSLGGGIYISEAKGNGTASAPYIPAVIQNATIQNNTAKCGGGISTSGPVKISDTTITGNTATKLEKWGGGGVNARIIPKSSHGNGWVFELSGKMNITGNYAEGEANNLYFHEVDAGTMLPAVTGLTAGSTIGVTTAMDSLQADNTIVPVYITSDKGETGYFTSDKGYIVRLDATQNQLYVIAESYSVSVTLGENMESTGTLTQDLLKGAAMTDVVITAKDGYYFPENYGFTQDGITVRRDGPTQITVTGTPTADASLVLLSATSKATPAAPTGLTGVAPTDWDAADGKISGTKSTMEWSADGKTWTDCTDTPTTVGISGTYYVRIKATDISYASAAAEVIVPKYLKSVVFPRPAMTIFFYDGTEHTLFVPSEDYTVSGVIKATDAGAYKATVTLDQDKYQWSVAPESDTITWLIGRKTALAQDFTFTAPENLIWDGTAKTAAITVNTPYTLGGCNTSLVYKQGDNVVASPTDPGTYQVYLVITGEGNFTPTGPDGFTADAWTFTIQHPVQHIWGDWQHNDTQHYRTCTVPGCTAEARENHTTDTPATCTTKAVCTTCQSQYGEVDTHNHPADKVSTTTYLAPTCGSKGHETYKHCAGCGKYFQDGDANLYSNVGRFDIAPLSHKNAVKTIAVAVTCTAGGNQAYWHCDDCGSYFADKDGKLDASTAYDSNDTFQLSALGHDYQGQPYQSDSTGHWQICKRSGCGTESTHEDHSGPAATCASASKCATCGYQLADIDPNHHVNAAKHEAAAATCTADGNEAYYACADCHKFFAVTADGQLDPSAVHDSAADFTLAKLDHSSATAYPAAAPDCENAGSSLYFRCDYCGKFFGANADGSINKADQHDSAEDFVLAPLAHKNAVKTDAVAAACTAGGSEAYYTCPDCGGFFGVNADGSLNSADRRAAAQDFATAPTGHDLAKTEAQAPACTETGNSEYYTCAACGKFFSDAEGANEIAKDSWVIAPTGHDLTKADAQAPTCTESGNSEYFTCATCGKFFSDAEGANEIAEDSWVIASLGHDFTQQLSDDAHLRTPASCTDAAEYFYSCSRCGAHSADKFFSSGDALGHAYTQVIDPSHLSTAAACTEDAVYYVSCSRCQANGTEIFAAPGTALGHSFTHYIYNNDATYDADGTETAVCDRTGCDATDTRSKTGTKLVDSAAPVVSGVENGGVYCLTVDITVSDPHLDTVTLNGQAVTLSDGKLTVSGQAGTQALVATDRFGNRTAVTFTVNPDHTPDAGKVVRQPTAATEGEKVFTCTVCGAALGTEPVAKLAPTVLEGTGSQYSSGSGKTLRFRYDASREDLLQVFVDGVMLRSTQYIVSGDSAVVTLTDSFLQTLSSGTHKLEAVFTTGTASVDFTVIASDDHPDVPTGDSGRPILWASLSGVCSLALLALPEIKKRRSHR